MSESPPKKRRRWPWLALLIAITSAAVLWKLQSDSLADRERLRLWIAEAEADGLYCAKVSFGGSFGGWLRPLDYFLRDKIAVSVRDDRVAAQIMEMKSPAPSGLILVDEGLTSEVAAELQRRFPKVSMPKIPTPPLPVGSGPGPTPPQTTPTPSDGESES